VIKLGQTIYVGKARLESVFNGYDRRGWVKAMNNGRIITTPVHNVTTNRRRKTGRRDSSWSVGDLAIVTIHGVDGEFDGEVIGLGPLKARIRTPDPLWFGAVIGNNNGTVSKVEEAA
jgi:hypothetical protein